MDFPEDPYLLLDEEDSIHPYIPLPGPTKDGILYLPNTRILDEPLNTYLFKN